MESRNADRPVVALLLATILFNQSAGAASEQVYSGKVVHISDGDTLTLLTQGRQVKVRLASIDTPEQGQPFGSKAKKALGTLAFGKQAEVVEVDWDRYGRLVGDVYVNGAHINAELVRLGYAWVYRKYSDDPVLLNLEAQARAAKRGLWATDGNIPPWEWRRGQRTTGGDGDVAQGPIIGNRRSGIYHLPECPDYAKVTEGNRVLYSSEADAVADGYRRAGNCP